MEIILWRHADAENAEHGAPDSERALTAKGMQQAQRMAHWLRPRLPGGAVVLASPARRVQQTAAALDLPFKTVDALAPGARVEDVLAAAGAPTDERSVLVVGHQPTLGEVAALLMTGKRLQWKLRKGALIWLAVSPPAPARLRVLMSPEFLDPAD